MFGKKLLFSVEWFYYKFMCEINKFLKILGFVKKIRMRRSEIEIEWFLVEIFVCFFWFI